MLHPQTYYFSHIIKTKLGAKGRGVLWRDERYSLYFHYCTNNTDLFKIRLYAYEKRLAIS
jgi:hypothetical protein